MVARNMKKNPTGLITGNRLVTRIWRRRKKRGRKNAAAAEAAAEAAGRRQHKENMMLPDLRGKFC